VAETNSNIARIMSNLALANPVAPTPAVTPPAAPPAAPPVTPPATPPTP
jgi:hypothetical protein